jgi:hypothetical protein
MYQKLIREIDTKHDPRHIEAFMRVEFGTLDHLPADRFRDEVRIAAQCVDEGGVEMAEQIAKSYGL